MKISTRLIFILTTALTGLIIEAGCSPGRLGSDESVNFNTDQGLLGGGSSSSSSSSGGGGETGIEAFQNGIYAFANTQGCVQCHGVSQSPLFALSDLNTAYTAAKDYVNFANPTASAFIQYSGNSHCGVAACSNPAVEASVQAMIVAWANAENGGGSDGTPKYILGSLPIPSNLPTLGQSPAVLRFQFSTLSPAGPKSLSGALLEVEIQLDNSTEYRVFNPRIGGNTAAVQVTGIHVFVKPSGTQGLGNEDINQGNLWDLVTATAAIFKLPVPLTNTPLTAVPLSTLPLGIEVQSPSDVMTIGFDNLQ